MMSEFFGSIIPSAIQAIDEAIKRANPQTVMRAFQFAATMAAAIIVMAAATVLNTSRLMLSCSKQGPPRAALLLSMWLTG